VKTKDIVLESEAIGFEVFRFDFFSGLFRLIGRDFYDPQPFIFGSTGFLFR